MYQIERRHTKCGVDFGLTDMLGYDQYKRGHQSVNNSLQ